MQCGRDIALCWQSAPSNCLGFLTPGVLFVLDIIFLCKMMWAGGQGLFVSLCMLSRPREFTDMYYIHVSRVDIANFLDCEREMYTLTIPIPDEQEATLTGSRAKLPQLHRAIKYGYRSKHKIKTHSSNQLRVCAPGT